MILYFKRANIDKNYWLTGWLIANQTFLFNLMA